MSKWPRFNIGSLKTKQVPLTSPPLTRINVKYTRQDMISGRPEDVVIQFSDEPEAKQWVANVRAGAPDFHYRMFGVTGIMGTAKQRTGMMTATSVPTFVQTSNEEKLIEEG